MSYDGPDRREENFEYSEIHKKLISMDTRLEVLISSVNDLRESKDKSHIEIYQMLKLHDSEIFGRGSEEGIKQKAGKIGEVITAIKDHTTRDNWIFGVIITMLMAIFGSLFFKNHHG